MANQLNYVFERFKRILFGNPLPTSAHAEERLSNGEALAILSSDALSSVAYATQEIVLVLSLAGAAALQFTLPITGMIVLLMIIVGVSYSQTIKAYLQGGGYYRVSHDKIGPSAGLVAGASLTSGSLLTVWVRLQAVKTVLTKFFPNL